MQRGFVSLIFAIFAAASLFLVVLLFAASGTQNPEIFEQTTAVKSPREQSNEELNKIIEQRNQETAKGEDENESNQSLLGVKSGPNYTALVYDLASATVVTDTAVDNDCSNDCAIKPLATYVKEQGGRGGMNGTYFCPKDYSWCSGKVNTFDFPVWNNRLKKWIAADKLFWGGRGMMVFRSGSAQFFANSSAAGAPSDITGGIVNFPSLLSGGNLVLDEGSLPANLKSKGARSGIGFGPGKLFLVVARNSNMADLANIFKSLGATDALNLDGGGSVALYEGRYRVGPGRSLPNAIIVK